MLKKSDEQLNIIKNLEKYNVICDCCAGSGKTTTALFIAKEFPNSNILCLTFNERLKTETRNKIESLVLENIEAHNYHSFCFRYYRKCKDDIDIYNILNEKIKPKNKFSYDFIILDELQDMSFIYFELVCKIIKDNCGKIKKMCVFGDINQSIFDNFGPKSDNRFLSYAEECFLNKKSWKRCNLLTSFRLTNQIKYFINECVLGNDRINTIKDGPKVEYIRCNIWKQLTNLKDRIIKFIEDGYRPDDIFILAYSVKKSDKDKPIRELSNILANYNNEMREKKQDKKCIPILITNNNNNDISLSNDEIKGKLVFTTFHKSKGLERPIIIIFGFDNGHYKYNERDHEKDICSNVLYVALTRSKKYLILLHDESKQFNGSLPFLKIDKMKDNNNIKITNMFKDLPYYNKDNKNNEDNKDNKDNKDISVTELIRYISSKNKLYKFFEKFKISEAKEKLPFPSKIKQNDDIIENVSDINSLIITCYSEFFYTGKISIYNENNSNEENKLLIKNPYINPVINGKIDIKKLEKLCLRYIVDQEGSTYRLDQIRKFGWMEEHIDSLEKCKDILIKQWSKKCIFEYILKDDNNTYYGHNLIGIIDCVDEINKIIWEYKCVNELEEDHFIQLALYAYLYNNSEYRYMLYNIKTCEQYEIKFEYCNLKLMVEEFMREKYIKNEKINNNEFLKKIKEIREKY